MLQTYGQEKSTVLLITLLIKVQAFLSEVYRNKLCSREFPAETLSVQHRVEQFFRSEGRPKGPHHRGYSSNVQFGQPTELPTPQLRSLAAINPLFTVEVFFNLCRPGQLFLSTVHIG
ncbi:hypothetical protein AMECASPLE_038907 [Ameca splendens]|uniref:Uncharacterized protein n=1 Tax=Ameca splendens TaxID=208324 RepID=A0ABV0XXC3_9TELE